MHDPVDPGLARSLVRLRVRFYETDLMGIVHHGSYVGYLEVGRVEWLRRRGVAYASWAQRGLHLAVVELSLRYRAPAKFDDELDVEVVLADRRAASIRFDYRLVRASDAVLIAEGSTRLACVDDKGALRRVHAEMMDVLARGEATGREVARDDRGV